MNAWPSDTKQTPTQGNDCDGGTENGDCDLAAYDDLSCTVDGISAEAEYLKKYKDKIIERRSKFDTTRTTYQQMLATVEPSITALRKFLADPDAALCQVDADDRRCLKDAWESVKQELEACGSDEGGCCVSAADRTFDARLDDTPTVPEIQALIARYEDQVGRVEACFDRLATEPAELKKRVDALEALVKQIKENKDLRQAYAQMLWAGYGLTTVYGGFANAASFENCLCIALNASLEGRRKLAWLSGQLAVLTCKAKARTTRCTWLRAHVVEEIVNRCRQKHTSAAT
jgi:hypothetical protein